MGFHTESDCVKAFYYAFYVKKANIAGYFSQKSFYRYIKLLSKIVYNIEKKGGGFL